MQTNRLDPSVVYPHRPKDAPMTQEARCPGCATKVQMTDWDIPDETLATNCAFYCEKEEGKWIDNPLCYEAKNVIQIEKPVAFKKKPKNKAHYKKKAKNFKKGVKKNA